MNAQPSLDHFVQAYSTAISSLGNLVLPDTHVRRTAEDVAALAGADGEVEDYTAEVFQNSDVRGSLSKIDSTLPGLPQEDWRRVRSLVNDLLLAGSLVAAREKSVRDVSTMGTTKVYQRQAIEVMPVSLLTSTLEVLAGILDTGDNPLDDANIRPLRYNENDALSQRLTSISLLNLQPETRTALSDSPSYQALLDSNATADFLFASNGHDEQQFMATCITSATSTDVKGRTPTLIGLVEIGRGVVKQVTENLAALEPPPAEEDQDDYLEQLKTNEQLHTVLDDQERSSLFGGSRTLRELVQSRIDDATADFDDIEQQVVAMAHSTTARQGPADGELLDELTSRWGRQMQKLSAVINVAEGVEGTSVLSKKRIKGAWMPGAVIALPTMVDRPSRRLGGIKNEYFDALSSQVVTSAEFNPEYDIAISEVMAGATGGPDVWVQAFWQVTQEVGGVPTETSTAVSEHHCYLKAVRRDGQRMFALSDPKVSGLTYMDSAEFQDWAESTSSKIATSVATKAMTLSSKIAKGTLPTEVLPITPKDEAGSDEGSEDGAAQVPDAPAESGSDAWALARWELAGVNTEQLVREQNRVRLEELPYGHWEPYWVVHLADRSVGNPTLVLVGHGHHEWFHLHGGADVSTPSGHILREKGRMRSKWEVSGTGEDFALAAREIAVCGHQGAVKEHGVDDSAIVQGQVAERNKATLEAMSVGDTVTCYVTPSHVVLIGDDHEDAHYSDSDVEGRIRKGRVHYYVDVDSAYYDLVKGSINDTGTRRGVSHED